MPKIGDIVDCIKNNIRYRGLLFNIKAGVGYIAVLGNDGVEVCEMTRMATHCGYRNFINLCKN